jgi:hypothetical protein
MTAAWAVPFITIARTQVAVLATSIYLHRALAHRSHDPRVLSGLSPDEVDQGPIRKRGDSQ